MVILNNEIIKLEPSRVFTHTLQMFDLERKAMQAAATIDFSLICFMG